MTLTPEDGLVEEAINTYGEYLQNLQNLQDLLKMALRHPKHEHQIKLLQIAVGIASGVGSFNKHQRSVSTGNWQTRQ